MDSKMAAATFEDPNLKVKKFCIFVFFRIYLILIGKLNLNKPELSNFQNCIRFHSRH